MAAPMATTGSSPGKAKYPARLRSRRLSPKTGAVRPRQGLPHSAIWVCGRVREAAAKSLHHDTCRCLSDADEHPVINMHGSSHALAARLRWISGVLTGAVCRGMPGELVVFFVFLDISARSVSERGDGQRHFPEWGALSVAAEQARRNGGGPGVRGVNRGEWEAVPGLQAFWLHC